MGNNPNLTDPLLRLNRVSVQYGSSPVLHKVSLLLHPGEVLGMVGESGSGKSTLALAIMGMLPPQAGITAEAMRFREEDMLRFSKRRWERVRGAEVAGVVAG